MTSGSATRIRVLLIYRHTRKKKSKHVTTSSKTDLLTTNGRQSTSSQTTHTFRLVSSELTGLSIIRVGAAYKDNKGSFFFFHISCHYPCFLNNSLFSSYISFHFSFCITFISSLFPSPDVHNGLPVVLNRIKSL